MLSLSQTICICIHIVFLQAQIGTVHAFSHHEDQNRIAPLFDSTRLSRRDYWKLSLGLVGGIAYGKLVGDTLVKLSQGIERPRAHEERVRTMISKALVESARAKLKSDDYDEPFRILEVGIGTDCRVARRGLYADGLEELESVMHVSNVDMIGTDVSPPSEAIVDKTRAVLAQESKGRSRMNVHFDTMFGDISAGLSFPSGYFDSIICCLTLCSVANQQDAIGEIKRLVRPTGGTFGYVEHVAVNPDEPYRFLEWQQEFFDPLQIRLADNCHLHRFTENVINNTFQTRDELGSGLRLDHERFLVDDMWPVTCQASGVIQRKT